MYHDDIPKTTFTTETSNFFYRVMPFELKNVGATYQRLMNEMFQEQIGRNREIYVDDMVVKSMTVEAHVNDLEEVLAQDRKYEMRLNPGKCVFGVKGGKFLGFMLTERGIKANPDKCQAIVQMRNPRNLKEVQRLIGKLTTLSRFLPALVEKARPIIMLLRKK